MQLTEQQRRFFDMFGFLKLPGLFKDEIDTITRAFEQVWTESGRTHEYKERSMIAPFADRSEYLSGLLDDPRMDGIVGSILGEDFNYSGSDGNYYVGDTNWHSDHYPDAPYRSLKIAFYLDRGTAETGCLRVIPGSCHHGDAFTQALHDVVPLTRHNRSEELWAVHGSQVPAYAIESEPGDTLMFNHKTKHSSWGGGDRRRMFTYNFEERMSGEQLPHLVKMLEGSMSQREGVVYGDAMIMTAGPNRMRHLEQRLALAKERGLV